jgi:hypothetical protein
VLRPILKRCEIKREGQWHSISIEEAVASRPCRGRCPSCRGPVRAHKEGQDGKPRAHFEHRRAHRGCKLNRKHDGKERPHPDAIE